MNSVVGSIVGAGQQSVARRADQAKPTTVSQAGFSQALEAAANGMVNQLHKAEAVSIAGIENRADTRQVVDAVMAAEHSLQTAIAIRDKIVSAYLDLSRMQI